MSAYQQLEAHFAQIKYYQHALTILHWDQEVMMPPGGVKHRAKATAELAALAHSRLSAPELEGLLNEVDLGELNAEQAKNLEHMQRLWRDAHLIPEELIRAESEAVSHCQHQWRTQRPANDWAGFSQNLKPVVSIAREIAQIRQAALKLPSAYDALLSQHCRGDSSELISEVFNQLKARLPELITNVLARQTEKPKVLGPFSVEAQKQISERVMHVLGFNFDCGRLDVSTHPFSTGNLKDQRITTRYREDDFIESLFATIHETGHARYEAGLPEAWYDQPLGAACNISIHESQSLFFEKHIGGSQAFCKHLFELTKGHFSTLASFSQEQFYSYVNWVEPGLIRVTADELTYPLHVILRYEIELALINGACEVDDIPELWNEKMREYLGINTVGDFNNGCMQDVHWPSGAFGYFPSYTLGAVNAAQLRAAFEEAVAPLDKVIESGDIPVVTEWLQKNIWQYGSIKDSQTLMLDATGNGTKAEYLLDYFMTKYNLSGC